MTSGRLIALLCVSMGTSAFSIGAFPPLLPELAAAGGLADWQLGVVAGAFGFARMLADVPAGLFVTHHVRRAMLVAPVFLLAGLAAVVMGRSLSWLVLGRALMGLGHTLAMLGGLTTIMRLRASGGLASALNAFEFSAMLGILGGVTVVGLLPSRLAWHWALTIACSPVLLGLLALRYIVIALPPAPVGQPWFARLAPATGERSAGMSPAVMLAFAAGGAAALGYATAEQFLIPIRGARDFGLPRSGVAQLLMTAQVCDIVALLPVGALADRRGTRRVLGVVLLSFGLALGAIAFATSLPVLAAGCVLFGLSMAGWMLPLSMLRAATDASRLAWRTALYRVCVDGGIFLGPFLSGLLAAGHGRTLPALLVVVLLGLGIVLLARRSSASRSGGRRDG